MNGAASNITVEKMHAKCEGQQKGVEHEFVGTLALARAKRARNGRRNTGAHAAVGRLQNEHHKRKRERGAGKRVGPDAPEKEAVEDDHADEGEQVEDVRCCKPQQRRQDRPLKQELGSRGRQRRGAAFGDGW